MEKALQLGGQTRAKVGPARVDDTLLIREAQMGNAAAFEELVRQYDRPVLRLAVHLTGSQEDGQDIYQEADRKSTRLNSSHAIPSRMPSSA